MTEGREPKVDSAPVTFKEHPMYHRLASQLANSPDAIALSEVHGRRLSFSDLDTALASATRWLHDTLEIRPGDRVGVMGKLGLEQAVLFLAIPIVGGVVVPLNYRASLEELRHTVHQSGCRRLVVDRASAEILSEVLEMPCASWGDVPLEGDVPGSVIEQLFANDAGRPAYLFHTGGSTGRPKGVLQSCENYEALAWGLCESMSPVGLSRMDRYLATTPPYHGGCFALLYSFLSAGCEVRLSGEFAASVVAEELSRGTTSIVWLVPTMIARLCRHIDDAEDDLRERLTGVLDDGHTLTRPIVISAGAPLNASVREDFERIFGSDRLVNMVGQTEVTSTIITHSVPSARREHPTASGFPITGCIVSIRDASGDEVPDGVIGELCYAGKMKTLGIYSEDGFRDLTGEPYFRSGDLGYRDPNGLLFMTGRSKDIIISGGVNIVPSEVEAVLHADERVASAVVLGLDDHEWGERVHAAVVVKPGVDSEAAVTALEEVCRTQLSHYKVPKSWSIEDALPLSAVGKVDRRRLRERIIARTGDRSAEDK